MHRINLEHLHPDHSNRSAAADIFFKEEPGEEEDEEEEDEEDDGEGDEAGDEGYSE